MCLGKMKRKMYHDSTQNYLIFIFKKNLMHLLSELWSVGDLSWSSD